MMAAVKPFSYLTGDTRPPPKSGFRKPGETYGTALHVDVTPRPIGNPNPSEEGGYLNQPLTYEPKQEVPGSSQREITFHDTSDAASKQQTNQIDHRQTDSELKIKQGSKDLSKQSETKTQEGMRPTVAPKTPSKQVAGHRADKDSTAYAPCTSREYFYRGRQDNSPREKSHQLKETSHENPANNYGRANRHKEIKTGHDAIPSSESNEIQAPFSYTDPIKPVPDHNEKQSSFDGQHKKSEFGDGIDDFSDLCTPSSPTDDNQNLFDNFILVGPSKTKLPKEKVASKEPTKKLKIQELFDPAPPPMPSPRKVSIFGVTNTESSDYTPKTSKGNNYTRVKDPASTFETPDYRPNISASSSVQEFVDCSSISDRSLATTSNSADKAQVAAHDQRRGWHKRLCIAILLTALVTSVICLGAGFIAGWFGKDTACKQNGNC